MISVITPVYKESVELVRATIAHLSRYRAVSEIIVVTTQSDPFAAQINEALQTHGSDHPALISCATQHPGRARQMNLGAKMANSDSLVFIHADTRLPCAADQMIIDNLRQSQWGRFDVELDDPRPMFRIIGWFMNKRSGLTHICTGDQALYMTTDFYNKVGGFPEQPLMEDIEFSIRSKKYALPAVIKAPVITSARRWQQQGVLKTILLMWRLRLLYWFGVPADKLARLYRQAR